MRIGIVLARARAFESWEATVPQGATVEDAMRAAGLTPEWLQAQGIDGLAFIRLDARDVVRHKIVQDIVNAYDQARSMGVKP